MTPRVQPEFGYNSRTHRRVARQAVLPRHAVLFPNESAERRFAVSAGSLDYRPWVKIPHFVNMEGPRRYREANSDLASYLDEFTRQPNQVHRDRIEAISNPDRPEKNLSAIRRYFRRNLLPLLQGRKRENPIQQARVMGNMAHVIADLCQPFHAISLMPVIRCSGKPGDKVELHQYVEELAHRSLKRRGSDDRWLTSTGGVVVPQIQGVDGVYPWLAGLAEASYKTHTPIARLLIDREVPVVKAADVKACRRAGDFDSFGDRETYIPGMARDMTALVEPAICRATLATREFLDFCAGLKAQHRRPR